jgi:hypothetical protein
MTSSLRRATVSTFLAILLASVGSARAQTTPAADTAMPRPLLDR